jgi:hypothetical protein
VTLRADDRVLFLAIPSPGEVARFAAALENGLLVALGGPGEVDAARAAARNLHNVMFIDARPDAVPWQESYFTKIVVPSQLESLSRGAAPELHRLLAPGGEIVRDRQDC